MVEMRMVFKGPIPKLGDIGEDECFVPGGWFQCGGDRLALRGYSGRRIWQDDVVIFDFRSQQRIRPF